MVQVKKVEVREAIVDAAARLFVDKGYVGTSTNEIGQRAGVAPSAPATSGEPSLVVSGTRSLAAPSAGC